MRFAQTSIWIISLFWLIPAMILFYIYAFRKKARLIDMFCRDHLRGHIMPQYSQARQGFKAFFIIMCILFLILALMRPRWGFHWEEIKRVGVDIIVAVDCSQSMMAEDVNPNRLERAKREIQDLLKMLDGDRIGLVAFAGTSFVQCPLTLDYGAFRIFLDYLDTDLIPVQGTAIAHAIEESIGCFDRTQKGSKAIILITDGEDHEADPLEAASEAKKRGIRIFPIGIGKEGGAPIPIKDGSGFKKDKAGNLILTKLDEKTLQRVALETGGSYVRSVTGDMDLEKIYIEGIKKMEHTELGSTKKRVWEERFQWFLFIALIMLIIEGLLPERSRIRIKRTSILSIILLFFLVCLSPGRINAGILPLSRGKKAESLYDSQDYEKALSTFLDAQIDSPDDPYLQYNIGNTYYKMKNYEEAAKSYQAAADNAKEIALEEKALYNMGNCAYRMGKLDEAIQRYQKALELNPDDEDARHNLEFVREEIKKRINQAKKQMEKGEEEGKQESGEKGQTQMGQENKGEAGEKQEKGEGEEKQDQSEEKAQENAGKEIREAEEKASGTQGEKEAGEDGAQEGYKARQLSHEEAERILEGLDEDQKKAMEKRAMPGAGRYMPQKDW